MNNKVVTKEAVLANEAALSDFFVSLRAEVQNRFAEYLPLCSQYGKGTKAKQICENLAEVMDVFQRLELLEYSAPRTMNPLLCHEHWEEVKRQYERLRAVCPCCVIGIRLEEMDQQVASHLPSYKGKVMVWANIFEYWYFFQKFLYVALKTWMNGWTKKMEETK